jgi:hypothetical protein
MMEEWNDGTMEERKNGTKAEWNNGLATLFLKGFSQYSNIPFFHLSGF